MCLRDPKKETIIVGGAAIAAHFISKELETPCRLEDVDVLCPQTYFDALLSNPLATPQANSFQLRWPKGGLKARGATNKSIDIHPDLEGQQNGIVPFTACVSMGDLMYPMDYDSCMNEHETTACGLRVMRLGEILRWISIIGRAKDLQKVEVIMPDALNEQLITSVERERIEEEYRASRALRAKFPERYYAHLDQSLVNAQYHPPRPNVTTTPQSEVSLPQYAKSLE